MRPETEIVGYVLGADAEPGLGKLTHGNNTTIKPMIYRTLLDRAHSRTFYLQKRIQESDAAMKVDQEVEDVISRPEQAQLLA